VRKLLPCLFFISVLLLWPVPSPLAAQIIYVDDDANGANNGTSWADAYNHLQDALAEANSAAKPVEVWVAEGTYKSDTNSADPNGSGDCEATFQLISGVALYGGFPSGGGTWNDRDPNAYETILSGDLDGNDTQGLDPCDLPNDPNRAENSYHVFYHPSGLNLDPNAILDGFTITGGNANGSYPHIDGGGMYNDESSPTLTNCTFTDNSADYGGGMYNNQSGPNVSNCTFSGNSADWSGGGMENDPDSNPTLTACTFNANSARTGGGMSNSSSNPILTNCTFSRNSAELLGGGMDNFNSNPQVTNSTFKENLATGGGGMRNFYNSEPIVTNCTFRGNSVEMDGGGMCNYDSSPTLSNCTFSGNHSGLRGGGMYNEGHSDIRSNPTITKCAFSGNSAYGSGGGMFNYTYSSPTVTDCIFSGNYSTGSNGGGMKNDGRWGLCNPSVVNCIFSRNYANNCGGGMINTDSNVMLINCFFRGNSCGRAGGGMCNDGSSPLVIGCTFGDNSADWSGGGMDNIGSSPTVTNCTFTGNSVTGNKWATGTGGGISNEQESSPTVTNCIVWGNTASKGPHISLESDSTISISHCNLQGGQTAVYVLGDSLLDWGESNIDKDPNMTPDGHLRSGSPCIHAGDPNFVPHPNAPNDIDGEDRIINGRVDIGADELLDTDGDGLPNWWEQAYFGDPNAASANADPDADGLTNLQEYEFYSSDPNTTPYYIDTNNIADPCEDGSLAHPFDTIQEGLDAAGDSDTVLVAAGTYSGMGNYELDYDNKSVIVLAPDGATIDCGDSGRAINFETIKGIFAVLEGFAITGGNADLGGGIRTENSRFMFKDCVLTGNTATDKAGGLYTWATNPTFNNLVIQQNTAPKEPNVGLIEFSSINLQGNLNLEAGRLDVYSSWFYGPGQINLAQGAMLKVSGEPLDPWGQTTGPTVIRTDVNGPGDIQIDAGQQLIIEGDALVNLSGSSDCNPDPNTGGHITVKGSLVVRGDATLESTNVDVKLLDIEGANDIQYNNITLLEASTGFGGEFFAGGTATIKCNTIVSEGDRYLDLDPDPDCNERPMIENNKITVIIKEGTLGSQGTLLELRAKDYDCNEPNNPYCESGAYQVSPNSPGFTEDPSENWVLEKLILEQNSKLNLTNRQGFEYQDYDPNLWTDVETVYVKELVMGPNSVLNTAMQTLYYQGLVDPNGAELIRDPCDPFAPLANGSRFEDIPVLGFSLAIIAMDDTTPSPHNEFDIRVRRRLRDPGDTQPKECLDGSNPSFCLEGSIERIDDDLDIPADACGVMDMRTQAPDKQPASSVAAKGAFARAGDEIITVEFEYMFLEDPYDEAELVVYLSDKPDVGDNLVEVARLLPPASGRPGSIGSGTFSFFSASFARGSLNFTRGTYVELELRGRSSRCWIDNWDPKIYCASVCGDFDGYGEVDIIDYLLLLAEFGLGSPASVDKACLDIVADGVVNTDDLRAWGTEALNLCPENPTALGFGQAVTSEALFSIPELKGQDAFASEPLLVLGNDSNCGDEFPGSYLYSIDVNGTCTGEALEPACPTSSCVENSGRLVTDGEGNIYQLNGNLGLIRQDTATVVVGPDIIYDGNNAVSIGFNSGEGYVLLDAAFSPYDPNIVYVVPVLVEPPPGQGCVYQAAAKLQLISPGDYNLVELYGKNPDPNQFFKPNCDDTNEFVFEPDVQHLREIEISPDGNSVFVLSTHWFNANNWILIYDEATGNSSEVRVWLSDSNDGEPNLMVPAAMTVSSFGDKLYLVSSARGPNDGPNDLTTGVYRFSIDEAGLTLENIVEINCPQPDTDICEDYQDLCDPNGFIRAITSMTENPYDGTLYATGFTSPRFTGRQWPDDVEDLVFTKPMLAVIPSDTNGPVEATEITNCDPSQPLALPLSIVGSWEKCGGADIYVDGAVNFKDLAVLAQYWLESGCAALDNCEGADLQPQALPDGDVDWADLEILVQNWLQTGCLD
jgi:hypothetical protein